MPSRRVTTNLSYSCLTFALTVHVYSPSNFFGPVFNHAGLSCSYSDSPHLCCCQHPHLFDDEGPIFTLVKYSCGEHLIY